MCPGKGDPPFPFLGENGDATKAVLTDPFPFPLWLEERGHMTQSQPIRPP